MFVVVVVVVVCLSIHDMICSDLVDGLIRLMNSNYSLPVNIGNPDEYTILQFAQRVQAEVGKNLKCSNTCQ